MAATTDDSPGWADAEWAAALLALIGTPLGGVHLCAPPGPVRDYWIERATRLAGQTHLRKIPANIPEGRLLGGIDLSATLQQGKPIAERGLLAECDGQWVIAAMAERLPRTTVHHLCQAIDEGQLTIARDGITTISPSRIALIAADEGLEDEGCHGALTDRLGIALSLQHMGIHDVGDEHFDGADIERARTSLAEVIISDVHRQTLARLSLSLGIDSPRALLASLRVVRGSAALSGRSEPNDEDIARALRLCLLPKAQQLPEVAQEPEPQTDTETSEHEPPPQSAQKPPPEEDRLLEAAMARLPPGLLEQLQTRALRQRQSSTGTSGAQHRHNTRGRPTGVLRGDPRRGGRVNILATLRAAAPWQPLRRRDRSGSARRIEVCRDDIHLTRFQQRRESLTLFVVDASGSAAMQRLAEAKGAVELLLADCYVRRDEVALIAFRDEAAELLLPPTRSLVRAKKALAALPGGGATPMAAALDLTRDLAQRANKLGTTMQYVLLTDGAANVARDGVRSREAGTRDALLAAQALSMISAEGLVIDTAQRPQPRARELADALNSRYVALPKADAHALNRAVRAAIR